MNSLVRPIDIFDLTIAEKLIFNTLKVGKVPQHIAIIMDGNRRYAEINKLTRKEVYFVGFCKMSYINALCYKLGVKEITLYMFSIENFKRSISDKRDLVDDLIPKALEEVVNKSDVYNKLGIKLRVIGKLEMLSEELKALVTKTMELTKNNNKFTINLAIAYSSTFEITNAICRIVDKVRSNELSNEEIDKNIVQKYLLQPMDVDLLLRTSGEIRFSDFMGWQIQNCNIQIVKKYWPEFNFWDFVRMIVRYQRYMN